MMKYKFGFLLIFMLFYNRTFAEVPISPPDGFFQQAFDVIHYDADFDFTQAPGTLMSGVTVMKVHWLDDPKQNKFYFHLRDLNIDSCIYNSSIIPFEIKENPDSPVYHYEINPVTGKAGDTVLIRIVYHGKMSGESETAAFGGVNAIGSTLYSVGVGFHNVSVSAIQNWMPCYDHPSDKATYSMKFKIKKGKAVAAGGLLSNILPADTNEIWNWKSDIPTSTYLMSFAIDSMEAVSIADKPYSMVVYTKPKDAEATKYTFQLLPDMVKCLETRFGPYPFEKVGYVTVPGISGAMEHQTMITINEDDIRSSFKLKNPDNSTVLHELSHQWFGDAITCRDFRDAWLNEGFATFCESVWKEYHKSFTDYLAELNIRKHMYINYQSQTEGIFPLYNFKRTAPSSNYPVTIYFKGAVVLGMLLYELGRDNFYSLMKEYVQTNLYTTHTTSDFQKFLEAKTGKNLDWFFNQWIYGKGWPVIDAYISLNGPKNGPGEAEIRLTQVQPDEYGSYSNLPIQITDKNNSFSQVFRMNNKTETFKVKYNQIPNFKINEGDSLITLLQVGDMLVGVKDENIQNFNISISPNPVIDELKLKCTGNPGTALITIVDLLGDTVRCETVTLTNPENQFIIKTADLPEGIYHVIFEQDMRKSLKSFPVVRE